jgi:hypothetical protein
MKALPTKKVTYLASVSILFFLMACGLAGGIVETATPEAVQATQIQIQDTEPSATQTLSPTLTQAAAASETPPTSPTEASSSPTDTPQPGPLCTVLTNLNLRSGPGTAYRPPVTSLETGTRLEPLGFNPVGVPGGPWVQVRVEGQDLTGFVSAGAQFVSCNLELNSLPEVAVAPPPPPPAPQVAESAPEGSFPETWQWELDFNPIYLLRVKVFDTLTGSTGDGDGIAEVAFTVIDPDGAVVLQRTEQTAGFCIFGGGEPNCNPWIIEDYVYKWQPGGAPAVSGDYQVNAVAQSTDGLETGNWRMIVKIQFP